MTLKILPRLNIDMTKDEECVFQLDITDELGTNTVASYTYEIYDSSNNPVTSNFGGGSSESSGVITFGIIAYNTGNYVLKFWVTCNEMLPDGITPYEFVVIMTVKII